MRPCRARQWKDIPMEDRPLLDAALEAAVEDGISLDEILDYTVIKNDTGDNWLRIGGYGYRKDYEHLLTDKEKDEGCYVAAYTPNSHSNIVLWIAKKPIFGSGRKRQEDEIDGHEEINTGLSP